MDWIKRADLEQWAQTREAQSLLPKLVRRLILATSEASFIDIPADEGINKSGIDGIVESRKGNAFVPMGKSYWEMGCGQEITSKANGDYNKRKDGAELKTSFIFITPRSWNGKREWLTEKRSENLWKDVRAYDVDDIMTWLEQAPVVQLWFSTLIGKRPNGADSLENWWKRGWEQATCPPLTPEVVLAGRDDIAQKIINKINSKQPVSIEGASIESAIAFLAATFKQKESEENFLSRAVIVDTAEAARQLIASDNNLIFIPRGVEANQACRGANSKGHIVCACLDPEIRSTREGEVIKIPYPHQYSFKESLEKLFENAQEKRDSSINARSKSEVITRETGRDIEVLRQKLAIEDSGIDIKWGSEADLVPAIFIGQWDGSQEQDKNILSFIGDKEYSILETTYRKLREGSNSPLKFYQSLWKLTSPVFAWKNIARFASRGQWDKFAEVANNIFSQPEQPPPSLWREHQLKKEGVAQSLAILSNRMTREDCQDLGEDPTIFVKEIVRNIVKNPIIFTQQHSFLSDLSEAAPDVFLRELENFLQNNPKSELIEKIAHNHHLMWVLESLAWVRIHLPSVTRCLGHLMNQKKHPFYSSPTPLSTLVTIFLPWSPQTEVSTSERIGIIRDFLKDNPENGWQLLMELFPGKQTHSSFHSTPIWLEFSPPTNLFYKEYFEHTENLLDLCLKNIGNDSQRWQQVVHSISYFPNNGLPHLSEKVAAFANKLEELKEKIVDKSTIWKELSEFVSRHYKFNDARWSFSEKDLKPWIRLRDLFEEKVNLIEKYAPLFSWHTLTDIPYDKGLGHAEWEEKVDKKYRLPALEEICKEFNKNDMGAFIEKIDDVDRMVRCLVQMPNTKIIKTNLTVETLMENWLEEKDNKLSCAVYYFSKKIWGERADGKEGYATHLQKRAKEEGWSLKKTSNLLASFPHERTTWKTVKEFGGDIEKLYWGSRFTNLPEKDEDCSYFITKALEYNLLEKAIYIIGSGYNYKKIESDLIAEVLEKMQPSSSRLDSFILTEIILYLQGKIEDDRLMRIERQYIGAIHFELDPIIIDAARKNNQQHHLTLHRKLAADPALFIDYITTSFKKDSDIEKEFPERSTEEKVKIEQNWHIHRTWALAPGMQDDGSINEEQLLEWIRKAREELEELDYLAIADDQIGGMLGNIGLLGKDDIWPIEAIRKVIEEIDSHPLREAIRISKSNNDGGQSGDIAGQLEATGKKYTADAQKLESGWPKTAKLLRDLADNYQRQADNWREGEKIEDLLS